MYVFGFDVMPHGGARQQIEGWNKSGAAVQPADTPQSVVEGFRLLKEYERTRDRDLAVRAYRLFERQLPGDSSGYAHAGLALTLHQAPFIVPASYLGGSSTNASARAATEALRRNPDIPGIALLLDELSTPALPQQQIDEMISVLKACCASATSDARKQALGALAGISFMRGRVEDTQAAADELLSIGGDSARAYRWLTLTAASRVDRARTGAFYAAALSAAAKRAVPELAADVALLDTVAGDSASLLALWEKSGFASGTSWSQRAVEHYVRLARAAREFRLTTSDTRGARASNVAVQRGGITVDDRGVILIRHGTPDTIMRLAGRNFRVAEAWGYFSGARGREAFVFVGLPGEGGVQLVDDPMSVISWETLGRPMLYDLDRVSAKEAIQLGVQENLWLDMSEWFARLSAYDSRYHGLAVSMSVLDSKARLSDVTHIRERIEETIVQSTIYMAMLREDLNRALTTESGAAKYAQWLPLAVEVYRFRDAALNPEIVPVMLLTAADTALHVRASFGTTSSTGNVLVDTTLTIPGRNTSRLTLPATAVQPGSVTWFVNAQADPNAGAVASGGLTATKFTALDVSDIVIGDARAAGSMRRGSQRIGPVPGLQVRSGSAFGLYYEVYGARAGEYDVTITIDPAPTHVLKQLTGIFGKKKMTMKVSFSAQADGYTIQQTFYKLTADLAPGPYRLRIDVRQGDHRATAQRALTIVPVAK